MSVYVRNSAQSTEAFRRSETSLAWPDLSRSRKRVTAYAVSLWDLNSVDIHSDTDDSISSATGPAGMQMKFPSMLVHCASA